MNEISPNSQQRFWRSVKKFEDWIDLHGYASYDPYDLWATRYGVWARRVYYENRLLGVPLTAPLLFADIVFPQVRALFIPPKRYPTVDAHLILAYLNLYQITGERLYFQKAEKLGSELLAQSIPGYSGHCWGYPFDWQNNRGFWPKNTPYITVTPYCFEAYLSLYDTTQNPKYLTIARSISQFVLKDLKDNKTSLGHYASSYSPIDDSKVVNASAYRAFVLTEAWVRWNDTVMLNKAMDYVSFICTAQQKDGSWLYALDNSKDKFIDHFHTCFVLKNLIKINRHLKRADISAVIRRGYDFYRQALYDQQEKPKPFARSSHLKIIQRELYDYAEAINVGVLLKQEDDAAYALSLRLAGSVCRDFQLPTGQFVTRVYKNGLRQKMPFLRWPQAQLFLALTNILLTLSVAKPKNESTVVKEEKGLPTRFQEHNSKKNS